MTDRGHATARARQLVLAALQDPASVLQLSPGDLDLTLRLMRRAKLLGRLAARLREAGLLHSLPVVAVDQLLSSLVAAEARQRAARWELDRIAWALEGLPDVPLVALKGCAYLLAGTPNAAGRTLRDVDLLVPETRLADVERQLNARGWRAKELSPYDEHYYRAWAHEIPALVHVERSIEVDLHHNILMRTARLKPSSELLLASSRAVPGSRIRVLAPIDMVLHAIVHLFWGGEMDDALRELVDIADLMQHFGATDSGFWEGFWGRAEALDLARPAYYGLRYARDLLGAPVPEGVIAASQHAAPAAPVWAMMQRLVPRALSPMHPERPSSVADLARLLLYSRSHWVKMPAGMLVRHLSYKTYAQIFGEQGKR